jgi:hypothetical protein
VRLRAVALAGVLCCLASACGNSHRERHEVSAYLKQVNAIELRLARPLRQVTAADRSFAGKHPDPAAAHRRLAHARIGVQAAERRLRALDPPPVARHLQALVLELVRREDALAGEIEQLTVFAPRFNAALRPLGPASVALRTALAAKTPLKAKASALDAYAVQVRSVELDLDRIVAPPVTRPTLTAQIATLRRVRTSVGALSDALAKNRAKDVPELLRRFDAAAVSNQSVAVQKAEIAAVAAYDARLRALGKLAAKIAREEARIGRATA